jgi:hypothetical protein
MPSDAQTVQKYRTLARLYHAFFTGVLLTVSSRKSASAAGDLTFKIFRRQHSEKFLSSFGKLGLSGLPDAVACAQYHYLSNSVGGVGVEYMYETDQKAWVHFLHPRWMYEGAALCGIPIEVSHGFLRGWYGHNGVSLGNPRLGFVCTSQDMDGQYGLAGYFREFDHDLAPDQRLQFAPGEMAPPFDPTAAPVLDAGNWTEERLEKAGRNYTMEYVKNFLVELAKIFGPAEAAWLGGVTGQLIGKQYYAETAEALGVIGDDAHSFANYLRLMIEAHDDRAEIETDGEGVLVRQYGWRLMRGIENLPGSAFDGWNGLWQGALSVHNRFLALEVLRRIDYGDDCFEWRIRPRR